MDEKRIKKSGNKSAIGQANVSNHEAGWHSPHMRACKRARAVALAFLAAGCGIQGALALHSTGRLGLARVNASPSCGTGLLREMAERAPISSRGARHEEAGLLRLRGGVSSEVMSGLVMSLVKNIVSGAHSPSRCADTFASHVLVFACSVLGETISMRQTSIVHHDSALIFRNDSCF